MVSVLFINAGKRKHLLLFVVRFFFGVLLFAGGKSGTLWDSVSSTQLPLYAFIEYGMLHHY